MLIINISIIATIMMLNYSVKFINDITESIGTLGPN